MPATLYHLAHIKPPQQSNGTTADEWSARVYADIANRLAELLDDVQRVWIDRDDQRELLTLYVTGRDGTPHPVEQDIEEHVSDQTRGRAPRKPDRVIDRPDVQLLLFGA